VVDRPGQVLHVGIPAPGMVLAAPLGLPDDDDVRVLDDLRDSWPAGLGGRLLGLYVHGSYVAGDFDLDRSDLDLLAVLVADPDEELLGVLAGLHEGLDRRHPAWAGRIDAAR
jgi:nucleotidyltransferase-like protein